MPSSAAGEVFTNRDLLSEIIRFFRPAGHRLGSFLPLAALNREALAATRLCGRFELDKFRTARFMRDPDFRSQIANRINDFSKQLGLNYAAHAHNRIRNDSYVELFAQVSRVAMNVDWAIFQQISWSFLANNIYALNIRRGLCEMSHADSLTCPYNFDFLGGLTHLRELQISANRLDLRGLDKLETLRSLMIFARRLVDWDQFPATAMRNLHHLTLRSLEPVSLACVKCIPLSSLDVGEKTLVNFGDIAFFAASLVKLRTYTDRNPDRSGQISDLTAIGACTKLEKLTLENFAVADLGVLRHLKNLKRLTLEKCRSADFSVLAELQSLTELNLRWMNLEDTSFVDTLSNLETFNVDR